MTRDRHTFALFQQECRRIATSSMVWILLILLFAAEAWGTYNSARLHQRQAADVARMAAHERDWYADITRRAARYGQPSTAAVPYWQDPTGASGFSRYFLRRFAAKPHLPLSVLAIGQSDVQPFAIPIRLETLFGGDRVYDFQPPRGLAAGPFDLSFVLLFILPLCVGAIVATRGALERDQGILPLVAAQPLSARQWWAIRLGALATVVAAVSVTSVLTAAAIAGAPLRASLPEALAALVLVASHVLIWIAIAGWCLTSGRGAVATASTVAVVWMLMTLGVPLAGSLVLQRLYPPPSPVADVNEVRIVTDAVQSDADRLFVQRIGAQLGSDVVIDAAALDYATRLVPITQEMEARLGSQEARRQAYAQAAFSIAQALAWLSPQLAFSDALSNLAGTDTRRHDAFLREVREFQMELRAFMYPRVLESVRSPQPPPCPDCPGRFTFTEYDAIPRFAMVDAPATTRAGLALRTGGWLLMLAAGIAAIGLRRARWAIGS